MQRVILESPYAYEGKIERNVAYARACARDCVLRGEAPIASHLLLTQRGILRDEIPKERSLGIEAGLVWGQGNADKAVFYVDFCFEESKGMNQAWKRHMKEGRQVERRNLPPEVLEKILNPNLKEKLKRNLEWLI